ncbi:hypothetical protein BV25DRAFT_1988148, partial [Artomyces pyxidatus]
MAATAVRRQRSGASYYIAVQSDSRLLSNLLDDGEAYHQHLLLLIDSHSRQSLYSLSAYASATTAAPVSSAFLVVAGSFAGADHALRLYARGVEAWHADMHALQVVQDGIETALRERELLLSRISHSPTGRTSPVARTDLSEIALAELNTLDSQIAEKRQHLDNLLVDAVQRGLKDRCKAMAECGRTWMEMGQMSLRMLEGSDKRDGECTDDMRQFLHNSYSSAVERAEYIA